MPIHELMVMYGYSNNAPAETSTKKNKKKIKKTSQKKNKDNKRKVNIYLQVN